MACWPGNEIFTTTQRRGQVRGHTRSNLNLEQGLIGAVTLLEKNKRFEWAFATTESRHSTGDVEPMVLSIYIKF